MNIFHVFPQYSPYHEFIFSQDVVKKIFGASGFDLQSKTLRVSNVTFVTNVTYVTLVTSVTSAI